MIRIDWNKPAIHGSFGAIYRGLDEETKRSIALKVLRASDDESIRSFQQEFRMMRCLQGAHIAPQAYSLALLSAPKHPEVDGHWGLTMDFLEGTSLRTIAMGSKRPTDFTVIRLARKVLRCVAILHGQDMLHRDLHAANIMLCTDGSIKLIDFGESCSAWLAAQGGAQLCLTNGYEPPEAHTGTQWSRASDLYMVAKSLAHVRYGRPLAARELPSTALGRWLSLCIADNPADRPQTCYEALAALA